MYQVSVAYRDTILNQVSVSVSRYNLEVPYPTLSDSVHMQLCGDIVNDLSSVSQLVPQRPVDDSLSLWLEVGTIKPPLRLYVAVADIVNLQRHMSRRSDSLLHAKSINQSINQSVRYYFRHTSIYTIVLSFSKKIVTPLFGARILPTYTSICSVR